MVWVVLETLVSETVRVIGCRLRAKSRLSLQTNSQPLGEDLARLLLKSEVVVDDAGDFYRLSRKQRRRKACLLGCLHGGLLQE